MRDFPVQLDFLKQHSTFTRRWLSAHPDWEQWLSEVGATQVDQGKIFALLEPCQELLRKAQVDEAQFMSELRLARQRLIIWLGFRDLNGLADLEEVMHSLSLFAESAINLSIAFIRADLNERFGLPWNVELNLEMPLMVVGMGKLGGRELNLSSDIDLIFLYEHEGETQGGPKSLSHHEWFTRMGKRLIKLLAEHDTNGFVFRVDMRLRPNGDSGPLVCSLDMLEEYLLVQGREWERYAWIKGRLLAPLSTSNAFMHCEKKLEQLIRPFVYRRHLDYGVISAIRELHRQIQQEAERRSLKHEGRSRDIKLGRGGIREIEFLAQMFQLMRGGTDPQLRTRATLEVLTLLAQKGILPRQEVGQLSEAYIYLRRLEHRLQIWEDQQTHYLPDDPSSRMRLAKSMDLTTAPENEHTFMASLDGHQSAVARYFEKAFVLDASASLEQEPIEVDWQLQSSCFPSSSKRWQIWIESHKQKLLPEKSQAIVRKLVRKAADFLEAGKGSSPDADKVLLRFFDLLEAVAGRTAYLAILAEYPQALQNVLRLLTASQWGAQYLTRHPHLLDHLLNPRAEVALTKEPIEYWKEVQANLNLRLDDVLTHVDGAEQAMDVLRVTHHTETFITLLADLGIGVEKALTVEKVSDHLSTLADLIVQTTLERVWPGVAKKFDQSVALPPFAVIAYGKLGGKELGYASDLDLVFLFEAQEQNYAAQEMYGLLAKRMINWLTAYTSAGSLFEIDTRLRPNGSAGFLVTNAEAFKKYQLREGDNSAWVWEHQALTRARSCAGSEQVGSFFDDVRAEVLSQVRNVDLLRREISEMRQKVHAGHPNTSDKFDLKHDAGGMVDIEFTVQFLILAYASQYPRLIQNLGNIALLGIAAEVGLIDKDLAQAVSNAYRLFRSRQHRLRLDGHEKTRIEIALEPECIEARSAVLRLWENVFKSSALL
ncbi:bifunctional [glutamate--ammonia ligase]-adenylyl-L-tyrosine phosphorylase/[glutamate--ammonia-ligase] adenylyltransferase [Polynucleobacter paneuropaeus]|uniref:bifunctional [glutamate--ammonia ligase]-adenylyl-L-tyrosine phosphorylase/[glutamate--ammonia-ligase] adenylyltransferase n=1 Tax=Polynucleobacter paneuropaeus TaxID=2527775 RepID=UPI001BFD1841|nr:bifunctional [glutamate--ammonia ligase]-adenylyl-L-tyrosine phosphorylase/[glutamate--ammonia-ligase] adenylyltransferase [Polynucleobacter paneuropaeus]MBT8635582.1 bifunctional [glutamate--ammonia ligase]-adenylyl-L-tyrosine phosphorylase/[glutamate--ammonia-ligase] adenylyltransferase [Polynucleobacter paneuropaeus]QWD52227.1 bifunctional [glutamate--ammonia ligase]-adenylyl-L-tyrosine phosphorylase/[glutamate--ammonia-ligase] adenylyltransferase [Polynucleobacter paneuropaeus]QWD55544.1 